MGFFAQLFGKKTAQNVPKNTESAELSVENKAETREALGNLQEEAEKGREQLRAQEKNAVLIESLTEQYDLAFGFNYANHLAKKTGKTPAQCFRAIEKVSSQVV